MLMEITPEVHRDGKMCGEGKMSPVRLRWAAILRKEKDLLKVDPILYVTRKELGNCHHLAVEIFRSVADAKPQRD
jgi:hypothetical protein